MTGSRLNTFAKIALILLALFCVINIISIKIEVNSLIERRGQLEREVAAEEEKVGELQNRLDTPYDNDYIAELANEKLNLSKPDSVIFYNDLSK